MLNHFNLGVKEKETNNINKAIYLDLKYKNRDEAFIEEQRKRIEYNYDLNMKYFASLDKEEFNEYLSKYVKKHKFVEVNDLNKYKGKKGVYIIVLDQYKQVYIGLTDRGIKERIQEHWNTRKESDKLIWGFAFNSRLSIDSFGALDTTRIFVKTNVDLHSSENRFVDEFDDKYLLNRTAGGIGSVDTYTGDRVAAVVAATANRKKRDFSQFIDEKEFYEKCNSLDTSMYENFKKNEK